ncbi:hypothetical protein [Nonomuraea sp. NPDC049695]|uniref:hypothetical protein n=1 Tax=Nonomuraea sp. NPDC049695 TaxID=3154734 RepID=UPI00341836DC
MDRGREFTGLRHLGMRRGRLAGMACWESVPILVLALTACAWLAGVQAASEPGSLAGTLSFIPFGWLAALGGHGRGFRAVDPADAVEEHRPRTPLPPVGGTEPSPAGTWTVAQVLPAGGAFRCAGATIRANAVAAGAVAPAATPLITRRCGKGTPMALGSVTCSSATADAFGGSALRESARAGAVRTTFSAGPSSIRHPSVIVVSPLPATRR